MRQTANDFPNKRYETERGQDLNRNPAPKFTGLGFYVCAILKLLLRTRGPQVYPCSHKTD